MSLLKLQVTPLATSRAIRTGKERVILRRGLACAKRRAALRDFRQRDCALAGSQLYFKMTPEALGWDPNG